MTSGTARRIHPLFHLIAACLMAWWLLGCGPGDPVAVAGSPVITTQPTGATVSPGATVSFSVAVSGSGAMAFQWQQNGVAIAGATSSSLVLTDVAISASGTYTVVVANTLGSVTSQPATLSVTVVNVAPTISVQPVSATVQVGGNANLSVVASGSGTLAYQWYQGGVAVAGATSSLLSLTSVTLASAGSYTVVVSNAVGTVTSQPAVLTVTDPASTNPAPAISSQPVSQLGVVGGNANFAVGATGTAPLVYQWFKDGAALTNGTAAGTTVFGATSPALGISGLTAASAGSYTVSVTNNLGTVTSTAVALTVSASSVPPVITRQPVSLTVGAGGQAAFSVTATGNGTINYQWLKDGVPVAGALTASLVLFAVTPTSAGVYSVTIYDTLGAVNSSGAVLTVTP